MRDKYHIRRFRKLGGGKLCVDSNGFRAKNFYVFTSSATNIREIINSLRSDSMISAHTADSVHTEVLMLVQIV